MINRLLLYIMLLACIPVLAQEKEAFSWPGMSMPVDIPMFLAGNFGELRSNHFHMGIDIKTQGRQGLAVRSVDDGHVSRIKISSHGYGKAIYIDHPNGYTTVYGHLKSLEGEIAGYTLDAHYAQSGNSINIYPAAGELPVKKGQLIALSGNTGGSAGPHLHFEIRQTKGQLPLNPLLFNLPIKDDIPPEIKGIRVYPGNEISSKSPYGGRAKGFRVQGTNGKYHLAPGQKISANGTVGIAVHTIDKLNGYPNKCGVYRIRMYADSQLLYSQESDVLDFSTQRYVNAHMDYTLYVADNMHYHKCFVLPNDELPFYKDLQNEGYFFVGNDTVNVVIVVEDAYGNSSDLTFKVFPMKASEEKKPGHYVVQKMRYNVANHYETDQMRLTMQVKALYKDLNFEYQLKDTLPRALCASHKIHNTWTPLQKRYDLALRVANAPKGKEDKMLIARVRGKGRYSVEGGTYNSGWIHARPKNFGTFTVLLDTIAPKITFHNIYAKRSFDPGKVLSFTVKDKLSGVEKIELQINGQWALVEYDHKNNLAYHLWDKNTDAPGTKRVHLKVTDERGNVASYRTEVVLTP